MSKTKVLVLLGGNSPERDVALRSGRAVYAALKNQSDIVVKTYDPVDGDDGLNDMIGWADVVLPILHGVNGEDGVIQKKIEALHTAFLGSSSSSSELSFDKHRTHEALENTGVHMPKHAVVTKKDLQHALFKKPFVLKPINGGSSVDTLIVRTINQETTKKATRLLDKYTCMIVEELVDGLEITVPVLGEEALPVIAIIPPVDEEFDYENKYNGTTQEICPVPENLLSAPMQKKARKLALKIHRTLHTEHLSRTDMLVTKEGDLVVLELNTMPGMTNQSLFPKAAAVAGYDMEKLTRKFVELTSN